MKTGAFSQVAALGLLFLCLSLPHRAEAAAGYPSQAITPQALLIRGPVNGLLINRSGKVLALYGDPRAEPGPADKVLFTHHRRDVVRAGRALVARGAEPVVPVRERELFAGVKEFWSRYVTARFHDYAQQTSRILAEPFAEVTTVAGGDRIDWEGLRIDVLDTPGYTRGSVSYLLQLDGKRIACVGDLMFGDGRILDLYSLQDAIAETRENGYHGYAARAAEVIVSLSKVMAWGPDVIIPARGPAVERPQEAVAALTRRLRAVFTSHFEIDALRWYRGDEKIRIQAGRVLGDVGLSWMPLAETVQDKLPQWIVPIANSRLIISRSGAAFLVDCGNRRIIQEVRRLQQEGLFKVLEGIYISHYHDDHTDQVQAAAAEFHCPVFACSEMRDLLARPEAYHLPAQTSNPVLALQATQEGERRRWHEFEFRYFYYPGQTLYHGGLVVRKDEKETVFFAGDSFTPTGIDDYCLLNRNLLEPEKGFLYCLNLLKAMAPDYLIVNQHVPPAFRFSAGQLDFMIENLRLRRSLLRELFPWDDPNFGVDEQWARFYPYGNEAAAGRPFELKVVVRNHSPSGQVYRITPHAPAGWTLPAAALECPVGPRAERSVSFQVVPPPGARGVEVVTADIAFGAWVLWDWIEAIVAVAEPSGSGSRR